MKSKLLKKALVMSATTLLLVSQMNIVALAEEVTQESGQTTSDSSSASSEEQTSASQQPVQENVTPENTGNEQAQQETADTSQAATEQTQTQNSTSQNDEVDANKPVQSKAVRAAGETTKVFASFDGKSIMGTNDTSILQNYPSSIEPKTLTIEAEFDTSSTTATHKVEIDLANGLSFANLPGAEPTNNTNTSWKFDEKTLPKHLQQVITNVTYTPNEKVQGNHQPRAGKVILDFSPGTESAKFDVSIASDLAMNISNGDLMINNAITVKQLEGTEVTKTAALEHYELQGKVFPALYAAGNAQTLTVQPGEGGTIKRAITESNGSTALRTINSFLVDKLDYTFKADKRAGLQNVKFTSNPDAATVTIDRDSDPAYDIVHIEVGTISLQGEQGLEFEYQTAADTPPGKYEIKYVSAKVIANGQTILDNSGYAQESQFVKVAATSELNLTTVTNNYYSYSSANDESTTTLGGFALSNQGIDSNEQKLKVEFDDPNIGVRIVSLPYELDGQIKNIVVKTNKGQTFNVATATGRTLNDSMKMSMYDLNLTSLGTVAEDEYITEVTADIGKIKSGAASYGDFRSASNMVNTLYNLGISYHGNLLSMPASRTFSAKATIVDADKDFTDESAISATNTMNVVDTEYTTFGNYSNLDSNVQWKSGEIHQVNANFKLSSYPYLPDATCLAKGFDVYIREGDYLKINPDNITVTYEGKTYRVADNDIVMIKTEDNKGLSVYKLELPEMTLGYAKKDSMNPYTGINVKYDVKVRTNAPTTSFSASEMIFISPRGVKVPTNNGAMALCNNVDKFDVDGDGNTATIMGTLNKTAVIQLMEQKDFTVTTAANLNDGPWVSYDYDASANIIDLNPSGDAKYQLKVTNNSGNTIEGYTALIPIPKEGEKTPLTPATPDKFDPSGDLQKEAFTWTASLLTEIDTSTKKLNYQILYATSYEVNKDSTAFKPWDQIANKNDIRMIKVVTTDIIEDAFSESIEFPLALTDPNADLNAGKTNIYSARIYREILGTAGYKASEPVAIRLQTGVISGQVFDDTNRNGVKDAGEKGHNGVTVLAYEAGSNRTKLVATATTKTIGGKDGCYEFLGLSKSTNIDVVFVNPVTDDTLRFSPKAANGSTVTADNDNLKAQTSNITPSGGNFEQIDAGLIAPVTINFNAGAGSTARAAMTLYPGEQIAEKPEASLKGHTLDNWYTQAEGGEAVSFPYTAGTSDATLYAHYNVNKYNVTFVDKDGNETTQQVDYDTLVTKPADPEAPTGYHFVRWSDAQTGGTEWNFATEKMPDHDITLYAQFEISKFTVTFVNDVLGTETTQELDYDSLITKPEDPVAPVGHSFVGWFEDETSETAWNFETDKMPDHNVTLHARFEANKYNVTFVDKDGNETTQEVTYDQPITKPTDPEAPVGHHFVRWSDAQTGGTEWNFETGKMPAHDMTLYAQFDVNEYTVTFVDSVNGTEKTQKVNYDELVTKPMPNPEAPEGNSFNGWYDAETGGNKWNFGTQKMPDHDVTLYARFGVNEYTVTFVDKDGNETTQEVSYDELITKPADPEAPAGHSFIGWYDAATGGAAWNFETAKMPSHDITLYARFEANEYTITFVDKDGNETTQQVTYDQLATKPADPEAPVGHHFVGWFDAETDGTEWNFATSKMPDHDVTLYARFEVNEYTVTFVDKDGNETTQKVNYDALVTKPVDPEAPIGHSFVGWFDAATEGTEWNFEENKMPDHDITLYSQFEVNTYTVTFVDTKTGSETTQEVNYDEFVAPPLEPKAPAGYTLGWFDDETEGTEWDFATNKMPDHDVTLYTHYQAEYQVLKLDFNGGKSDGPSELKILTDDPINVDSLGTPTKAGYRFTGWLDPTGKTNSKTEEDTNKTTDEDNEAVVQAFSMSIMPTAATTSTEAAGTPTLVSGIVKMPAGGLTLVAQWEKEPDPAPTPTKVDPKSKGKMTPTAVTPAKATKVSAKKALPQSGEARSLVATITGLLLIAILAVIRKFRGKKA